MPATVLPTTLFTATDWLALLDTSLTGIQLLRPVYAPDGLALVDFAFAYTNPTGLRILGASEQLDGTLLSFFPHPLAADIFAYSKQAFATDKPLLYEVDHQADGVGIYLKFNARCSGEHLLVSFTNTRDQPRSAVEEALRASQAAEQSALAEAERQRRQWHELFMRASISICIFDGPEWVYEFVNPGYQAMFPGRALLGKRLVDALPEVADQPLMAILHHVYDTGEPFEAREVLVPLARTEGGPVEDIYFDLTYQARYNEAGQIDGFITYAHDVTAQVLARRAREAQQGELQRLFEQAPVAIGLFTGDELRITALNPPMATLFGYPAAQLLGRPLLEALPELRGQGFDDLMRQVQTTQVPFVGQELPVTLWRNGETQLSYYNLVYQPLYNAAGQVEGIFEVAVEVTAQVLATQRVQILNEELAAINEELAAINEELRATNEELHQSNVKLTRTNADLDTFIYTASHDLKAPITNIEGLLLALKYQLPAAVQQEEDTSQLLGMMHGAVERFQFTINQLTDVSRLQHAQNQPAERVQLAAVIKDVQLDLRPLLLTTRAQFTVDVGLEVHVLFPSKNLRSVVYNLFSNALKYHQPDRPAVVHLRATTTNNQVLFAVQDEGLGMNKYQLERLFGLFQRLHVHVEGSGVGLYMVKRMVENAGGTITVESEVGVGTSFTVTLPSG